MFIPTVFESYVADITVDDKHVELALWDTAGQEDYDMLRPLSYPNTDVVLIAFAIDLLDTLDNVIEKWVPEVFHFCSEPAVPYLLVGCKKDLRTDRTTIARLAKDGQTPVTEEQGREVAARMGAKMYVECSARTGEGVAAVFEQVTRAALLPMNRKKKRGKCRVC